MPKDWKEHLDHWLKNGNPKLSETVSSSNMRFIQQFPIERITELTLESYTGSFCDYLDYGLNDTKDIYLGADRYVILAYFSYKFGLERSENSEDSFNYIKNGLLEFLNHAILGEFSRLDFIGNTNLKNLFFLRSRVLYLYFPDRFSPIFSPIHQKHFIEIFDKHFSASFHYENLLFTEYLKSLPEFSEFDSWQIKEFLYSEFPPDLSVFSLGLAYSRVDSYDVDVLEVINYHHPELTSVIKTVLGNNQDLFTIENKSNTLINSIKNSLLRVPNLILYGPPGTGKTYIAKAITDSIIADQVEKNRDNSIIFSPQTSHYSDYVAFHQSFSYEDFIEGLKPTIKDGIVTYSYVDGIFKEICKRAKGNPDNKYILIIDEINRANIAKIFGELITLLESDKRLGTQNELKVTLPYSKQSFGIPANLYIIGTMNTSDHSIALLDIALRRRFTFIEIMPNPELLKNSIIEDINLGQLMEVLNHKIRGLIGRDYQIGHSYLMNIDNLEELEFRWYYQIVPLLQEYCYNNWQQLQLIIGSDFIKEDTIAPSNIELQPSYSISRLSGSELIKAFSRIIHH